MANGQKHPSKHLEDHEPGSLREEALTISDEMAKPIEKFDQESLDRITDKVLVYRPKKKC